MFGDCTFKVITTSARYRWVDDQSCAENKIFIKTAVKKAAPASIRELQCASLPIHGQQLFNTLPPEICNLTNLSVDCFKRRLVKYLQLIPDEPQIPWHKAQRWAESNSLLDMTHLATAHLRSLRVEVPGDSLTPGNRGCAPSIAVVRWYQKIQTRPYKAQRPI